MTGVIPRLENPAPLVRELLAQAGRRAVQFEFRANFLAGEPRVDLLAVMESTASSDGKPPSLQLVLTDDIHRANQLLADPQRPSLQYLAETLRSPVLDLLSPIRLSPVAIPKPWGREVWYTGMESRGQAEVTEGRFCAPLAWLLALSREVVLNHGDCEINLLKILDPLPEEVYGDLYFELHEEKQEVYVVTHVDRRAWPDGVGAIRYGFNGEKRSEYPSDHAFRAAYLDSVLAYEKVRREIDARFDEYRAGEGIAPDAPVQAERLRQWNARISPGLRQREVDYREAMNAFTRLLPLRVGDVVNVPCRLPHSLQHGVRTIEFQTPVYERRILAFAQKVLTQPHWDTAEAVAMMTVSDMEPATPEVLEQGRGVLRDRVVRFDDFQVQRIRLEPQAGWTMPDISHYALVIVVSGELTVGGETLAAEEAVLVPAVAGALETTNSGSAEAVFLISEPVAG